MKKNTLWQLIRTTPLGAWRNLLTKFRIYKALLFATTTPLHVKGLMVFSVLYLLMPLDFIPDTIPLLGVMDDLAIIGIILSYADQFITAEIRQQVESSPK
jgi:uncharacterized membrane protein YkvA (DUF1232 family)